MRRLKLQMQVTVDGFMAGPNGEMDWMTWEWDDELMPRNAARLDSWNERAGSNPDLLDEVRGRLDDDLDTPAAATAIANACNGRVVLQSLG